ncbi:hypothetical protein FF041_35940 [Streptomyces jumonjinensis]|uniref:Uncharacterized protein n=1 Tax=Streptomyces jumonjinensis TaxID=1945 RepID=A0A646KSU4_STRJU|nr:hypothetical protein [Streptomyces jumonjinensis]
MVIRSALSLARRPWRAVGRKVLDPGQGHCLSGHPRDGDSCPRGPARGPAPGPARGPVPGPAYVRLRPMPVRASPLPRESRTSHVAPATVGQ